MVWRKFLPVIMLLKWSCGPSNSTQNSQRVNSNCAQQQEPSVLELKRQKQFFSWNYGFLTDFSKRSTAEVKARIASMLRLNVKEFQFYDWFTDYSTPYPESALNWKDPYFHTKPIWKKIIKEYIDEIHRNGGRAWAYVLAVGSQSRDLHRHNGIYRLLDASGNWLWHEQKIPLYFANEELAEKQVSVWAEAVKALGFDGIRGILWSKAEASMKSQVSWILGQVVKTVESFRTGSECELRGFVLVGSLHYQKICRIPLCRGLE